MKRYHIKVNGRLIPVSKAVYQAYYKAWRRERYLIERDGKHGLMYYHALDTDDFQGESIIADDSPSVEDTAIHAIMLDKLNECLKLLNREDRQLIILLFGGMSERDLAKEYGISNYAIHYRKQRLLKLLKNLLLK